MSATVSAAALAASSSLAAALADPSAGAALAAVEGLGLGAGLIIAIGAQNAYVLRQGLRRQHVFAVATVCFLIDCMLIALGAGGFASLLRAVRSEERRVGKECVRPCRYRGGPVHSKKNRTTRIPPTIYYQ